MKRIKFNSMFQKLLFCILIVVSLIGLIEREVTFIEVAVFVFALLLSGTIFILLSLFLTGKKKKVQMQHFFYQGKLTVLIEELRFIGLYFYQQIGDVYIFGTKRIFSGEIRLLVTKENNYCCIACDDYSSKQLTKHSFFNLSIQKELCYEPDNNNSECIRKDE